MRYMYRYVHVSAVTAQNIAHLYSSTTADITMHNNRSTLPQYLMDI